MYIKFVAHGKILHVKIHCYCIVRLPIALLEFKVRIREKRDGNCPGSVKKAA